MGGGGTLETQLSNMKHETRVYDFDYHANCAVHSAREPLGLRRIEESSWQNANPRHIRARDVTGRPPPCPKLAERLSPGTTGAPGPKNRIGIT